MFPVVTPTGWYILFWMGMLIVFVLIRVVLLLVVYVWMVRPFLTLLEKHLCP